MDSTNTTCATCTSWIAQHWEVISSYLPSGSFWGPVWSTVIGAAAGAFLAFELERRRRKAEQLRDEIGYCHQLGFLMLHRLQMLEDFRDYLFLEPKKSLGRDPEWEEVESLDGAPKQAEPVNLSDYVFLVDGREHESDAPLLLSRVRLSTHNVNVLCGRLSRGIVCTQSLSAQAPLGRSFNVRAR